MPIRIAQSLLILLFVAWTVVRSSHGSMFSRYARKQVAVSRIVLITIYSPTRFGFSTITAGKPRSSFLRLATDKLISPEFLNAPTSVPNLAASTC